MSERIVFFVSDQTGVTAETLGHSLLTQFDGHDFKQVTLPFIDNDDKAREAVAKINEAAIAADARPIVFSTLVQDEFRSVVREANGLHLDIFDVFLKPLEDELQQKSTPHCRSPPWHERHR
jgi:regulator of PEP synthase PpsR (kinase-PPPase family)